ncbi:U-box domain-containing protein 45-like [Apium graveolens]|uniref:U-box domain-containing protein 45-like n=1 Tax=Apium graveolens TaxID=4045 RepID=UPI003D790500
MSDQSSTCFSSHKKLKFFAKIRRFMQPRSSEKQLKLSDQEPIKENKSQILVKVVEEGGCGVLQRSVKRLHFGNFEEKEVAAKDIIRVAREDLSRRKLMAELGVIPPLVAMVGSEVVTRRSLAVRALAELANGTYRNKALMVESGILWKLPENIGVLEEQTRHEFAQLVLSISSLHNSQVPINLSKIVPLVISILESDSTFETKQLCLGTLYNLSTMLNNAGTLVSNGVINNLLRFSSVKETSEKALATLGNLVVTLMGKKALESNLLVPENLIEIMTWEDKPKSQEISVYILMILAHQSSVQRLKMAEAGIVHVLLQVSLLGTTLARKRALKLLQWFKDERQTRMGPHSGPQTRRLSIGSPTNHNEASEGKRLMKNMVRQSLYKNLETITRRANADEGSSKLKFLATSSSSKSLPY